ncbi:FAD-dependent oxidoreductase [Cohnella faecalis]|uniref:FAD-dependent oxidoreductase n=1 Tax=Cohnella faecalis TaxID=2315694 RepID=A0A398CCE0_9BACL|nr:FAD-dependent oxidoreductase [Cohnella faecalis]RIE00393.1 FAD-dependent oxidoreductase [Cohnella faecalis]
MKIHHSQEVDVAVLGGGAAGIMAATSAARHGMKVLLVENQGCLGGSRTAVGVDTFYGFYTPGNVKKKIVGGIPDEVIERLRKENAVFERPNTYGAGTGLTYDVEVLKLVYEDLVLGSDVKLLYHTSACYVNSSNGTIESVILANKQGLTEIKAKRYVDTTGDADIVYRANGQFIPLQENETLQSLSTIFFMANVDTERAGNVKHSELVEMMKSAVEEGGYELPRLDGSYHNTPNAGVIQANMVRVPDVDATDPYLLTLAEVEGRKQVRQYARFLKDKVPGFENAFLMSTGQHIGVRETRKIKGHYILTEEDVVEGKKFVDSVACCAAPIEDHNSSSGTRWVYVKNDEIYNIPYRSLVPSNLNNVIVAGRCISATHGAQASVRNSAQAMALGQAAGTAAALSIGRGEYFPELNIKELQTRLIAQKAII